MQTRTGSRSLRAWWLPPVAVAVALVAPSARAQQGAADDAAIRAVPDRLEAAYAAQDAAGYAGIFTEDAVFVLSDGTRIVGRSAILAYMTTQLAGPWAGTRITADILSVKVLAPGVAMIHTTGGVLNAGETVLPQDRSGTQIWVVVRVADGTWQITAFQNTRSPAV